MNGRYRYQLGFFGYRSFETSRLQKYVFFQNRVRNRSAWLHDNLWAFLSNLVFNVARHRIRQLMRLLQRVMLIVEFCGKPSYCQFSYPKRKICWKHSADATSRRSDSILECPKYEFSIQNSKSEIIWIFPPFADCCALNGLFTLRGSSSLENSNYFTYWMLDGKLIFGTL